MFSTERQTYKCAKANFISKNLCSPPNAVAGDGGRKIKQTMGLNQKSVDRENAANTGNRGGKSGQ